MLWIEKEAPVAILNSFVKELEIDLTVAHFLIQNGIRDVEAANRFLSPQLADLNDPFELKNMQEVVLRIEKAISENESITILGDYDVDGVTSTTLLVDFLNRFGTNAHYFVPRRLEEGYGLTHAAIQKALELQIPKLFIALDCGTNSVDEVQFLKERGVDVIIIDHHHSKDAIPTDCILINPHVLEKESSPGKNLCAVGLVFKVVHALLKKLKADNNAIAQTIRLSEYLDLVALGTIADLVPLLDENRILVKKGLMKMRQSSRPGFKALLQVSELDYNQEINASDIAFRLGPRINASGRLADASIPIQMLLSKHFSVSLDLAKQLNIMNQERQNIERAIVEEALSMVNDGEADHLGIVLYNESWHFGVLGIVAGKLSREYNRPCIILGNEGCLAKGSGRSIAGINLVKTLTDCDHLLESWGGHPMAVGISLAIEDIDAFRATFNHVLLSTESKKCFDGTEHRLEITKWLIPEEIGSSLLCEIDTLHPFGQGNPEPIFGLRNILFSNPPSPIKNKHFRFQIIGQNQQSISGIAWNQIRNIPPSNQPIDIAIKLIWNYWSGRKYPQIELVDWRISECKTASIIRGALLETTE